MESLYKLNQNFLKFKSMLEEMEEIDDELISDTMEGIEGEFHEKAEAYGIIINEFTANSKRLLEESKRLMDLADGYDKKATKLKEQLKGAMILRDDLKFQTEHFKFSVQGNGGACPLVWVSGEPKTEEEIKTLPKEYQKAVTKYSVDSSAIREALDKGENLSFVSYGERGKRLSIK